MSPTDRNDSEYNLSSMNAEVSRADRRRNIIETVEKRLSDLRGRDPLDVTVLKSVRDSLWRSTGPKDAVAKSGQEAAVFHPANGLVEKV
jgi:hypothetical protein